MHVFVVAGSPVARQPWGMAPGPEDFVIAADLGAQHARAWGWRIENCLHWVRDKDFGEVASLARTK